MLFNSYEFVVFLFATLLISHGVLARGSWDARKLFLVLASFAFYMSWNASFGVLLLGSTVLDYTLARRIEAATAPDRRRRLLIVSVCANLGVLGFFKYGRFAAENLTALVGRSGDPPLLDLVLPIGISFYTFESLSYVIDVYRGEPACRRFLDFALFLSFFPHLVAGPIVRPRQFLPQLREPPRITGVQVELAIARIVQGFVKKLILADGLGRYVDLVWNVPGAYPSGNVLLAIYAYAFQIYFDFSGYTDIALGLAQLWGFELPENFARPYAASNPRDFWQRWHISLSTWLRDYLYVSLGGNRWGPSRTRINLFLTMLLGGLWHGAAWTFVLWGAFHGAWLILHRAAVAVRPVARSPLWLRRVVTFHLTCLAWALFRAPSLGDALPFLSALVPGLVPGGNVPRELIEKFHLVTPMFWVSSGDAARAIAWLAVGLALHALPAAGHARGWFARLHPVMQGACYTAAAVALVLESPAGARFIYFQF